MSRSLCELTETPIDRSRLLKSVRDPAAGAVVVFDGVVRNQAGGRSVRYLEYHCYPEMALLEMRKIAHSVLRDFPVVAVAIIHRTGRLEIGESSVQIAVSSAHRADAFRACLFAIDTLKRAVPIWKKEHYLDGECWIEGATNDE